MRYWLIDQSLKKVFLKHFTSWLNSVPAYQVKHMEDPHQNLSEDGGYSTACTEESTSQIILYLSQLSCTMSIGLGVARGGPGGPGPPPIKIPLTTKSYDNIAWRCLVAVFFFQ